VFRNILVAIDGSRAAGAALEEAIDLAVSDGARLTLISVAVPPRFRYSGPMYVPYPTEHDLERAAWEVAERGEALVPVDVAVSSVVRSGRPAAAIVAQAEEGGHDLVVVGSRGLGRLGALVLGSVSRAVCARSSVPVLVARRRGQSRLQTSEQRARPEVHPGRSAAAVTIEAEPVARAGGLTVFLWLVVALLLEIELALLLFDRMYAP
jgi:nucleotide-binding universal stress UspA family protein